MEVGVSNAGVRAAGGAAKHAVLSYAGFSTHTPMGGELRKAASPVVVKLISPYILRHSTAAL